MRWANVPEEDKATAEQLADGLAKAGYHTAESALAMAQNILDGHRGCAGAVSDHWAPGRWRQCNMRPLPGSEGCRHHQPQGGEE